MSKQTCWLNIIKRDVIRLLVYGLKKYYDLTIDKNRHLKGQFSLINLCLAMLR